MDAHDIIEVELSEVIPGEGIDDAQGVTHTQCSLAFRIEDALAKGGHLIPDEPRDDLADDVATYLSESEDTGSVLTAQHVVRLVEAALRGQIAAEIQAEREDTADGIGYDSYLNGLMKAEEIARKGRQ